MFNSVYARVAAVAAMVMAKAGLRREDERPLQAPHRSYDPPRLPLRSIPVFRPAIGHSVGGSLSWGKWRYPRQEGELARRRRQIEAGTLTASNGLLFIRDTERFACNSRGELHRFYG